MKLFKNLHNIFLMLAFLSICLVISSVSSCTNDPAVTLTEDAETYTLDNGIVTVHVAKASGDLVSLRYNEMEMLATFLTPEGEPDLQRDPPGASQEGQFVSDIDIRYALGKGDAGMMKAGTNTLTIIVPAGPVNNGMMYDYIRLELDETLAVN